MKKIFKLLILSILFLSFFKDISLANTNIIENEWYLFLSNWIYYWKKKLDEEKFQNSIDYSTFSLLKNQFYNNQNDLLLNLIWSNYYRYKMYQSFYYDFKISSDYNISKIENHLWEELDFYNTNINWINNIKLYYNSFFNLYSPYYWYQDYIIKDKDNYIKKPELIKFYLSNWDIIEINFKFYIPEINFGNDIYWDNTIILNQNNEVEIINNNSLLIESIKINNDNWLITNYWNDKITTSLEYLNYNTPYRIWFINNYDLFINEYEIFNYNSCNENDSKIEFWQYNEGEKFNFSINSYNDSWKFKSVELNISKYNLNSKIFETINNYEVEFLENNELKINWLDDWIYKIIPSFESFDWDICKNKYNIIKNYEINSYVNNNNFIFYNDNWFYWWYWTLEKIFPYLANEINFNKNWYYESMSQKIERFDFEVETKNWNKITSWNLECINDWYCIENISNEINNYINSSEEKSIIFKLVYKDKFNLERNYKKEYKYNDRKNNNLNLFYNWSNFSFLETWELWIEIINDLDIKNSNWENIIIESITNEELSNYYQEIEEDINLNNLSYDDFYLLLENKIYDNKNNLNIFYNFDWYRVTIFINKNNIKNIYEMIVNENEENIKINLKETIDKFYFDHLNLESIWNEYVYLNSWIIENINEINIFDSNNIIIEKSEIDNNEINIYNNLNNYYELYYDEEYFKEKYQNKIIYKISNNNFLLMVPINIFEKINKILLNSNWIIKNIEKYKDYSNEFNFSESKNLNILNKKSDYWYFAVTHNFIKPIDNSIFIRKLNIVTNNSWFLKIDLDILWNNIKNIDYSKLYICSNFIENTQDILWNIECYNYEHINNFWLFFENINNAYIYWLNWIVNSDFEKIIINFKIEYSENIIPQ